jgi:UDP-glucose 4-epimerase
MAADHQVTVLDNLSTGQISNIDHLLGRPGFQFICDAILNAPLVDRLVAEADVVYHLAATVGVKYVVEDPLQCIVTNVRGTEVLLESAYRYWRRVVIASSSEVYGKSEKAPLSEDDDSLLGPTAVGRWSYALSKALDEHLAFAYHRQGLPVSVVRYFNSYGPRLDPRGYGSVVARFIKQALDGYAITVFDDGRQTRCFTYVDDTVRGTLLAGTLPEAEGRAFNIGNSRETSILELAQMVRDAANPEAEIKHVPYAQAYSARFEETRRRVPDTHRARDLLGFEAEVSLEVGLQRTIEWFREQR